MLQGDRVGERGKGLMWMNLELKGDEVRPRAERERPKVRVRNYIVRKGPVVCLP